MSRQIDPNAAEKQTALSEIYPVSTDGAVPALDQYAAPEAYREHDNDGLEAIPGALAAYLDFHQRQWL